MLKREDAPRFVLSLTAGLAASLVGIVCCLADETNETEPALKLGAPAVARPTLNLDRATAKEDESAKINLVREPGMSAADAWDHHFSTHQESPGAVRRQARSLMAARQFDETSAMINAALNHGAPQPWMYEAMAISLELGGAAKDEIERALMSAVDFSEEPGDLMLVAAYLAHRGFDERALDLFRGVSQMFPHRVEPYIQGLQIARRLEDAEAVRWACLGILSRSWSKEHREIELTAYHEASASLEALKHQQKADEAKSYRAQLNAALVRDCVIKITWTGDADLDLSIAEPAGTICSLHNPRTTSGGVLLGDSFSSRGGDKLAGNSEVYICGEAFSGQYQMMLRRVWGDVTADTVTVDFYTYYRTTNQQHMRRQIKLGRDGALVEFEIEQGRRQEMLPAEQVANAARDQISISREVVTRQLGMVENSLATRRYEEATKDGVRDGRLRRRGSPGFRPQITTLPSGTNMTATAVVSADRRYVRVTPTPLISAIGMVSTFNFGTGGGGMGMGMGMAMGMAMAGGAMAAMP